MPTPWMYQPAPGPFRWRWTPWFFLIVGILAFSYVAITLLDASLYQSREVRRFEQSLREQKARKSAVSIRTSEGTNTPIHDVRLSQPNRANAGQLGFSTTPAWGRLEIAAIGVSSMVQEGVDQGILRRGIGHIPGTALPGQKGNVALAGHRDTFFKALRNIHKGDEITLETLDGTYRYRVDLMQIVGPEHTQVLASSENATLTLVTCYPFSFVGPAPQRFIVRAHRVTE